MAGPPPTASKNIEWSVHFNFGRFSTHTTGSFGATKAKKLGAITVAKNEGIEIKEIEKDGLLNGQNLRPGDLIVKWHSEYWKTTYVMPDLARVVGEAQRKLWGGPNTLTFRRKKEAGDDDADAEGPVFCKNCEGTGKDSGWKCPKCLGSGWEPEKKKTPEEIERIREAKLAKELAEVPEEDFDPSDTWQGPRAGKVFKLGARGQGYYKDLVWGPAYYLLHGFKDTRAVDEKQKAKANSDQHGNQTKGRAPTIDEMYTKHLQEGSFMNQPLLPPKEDKLEPPKRNVMIKEEPVKFVRPEKKAVQIPPMSELEKMSAKELKKVLVQHRVSCDGCFDKETLLERAQKSQPQTATIKRKDSYEATDNSKKTNAVPFLLRQAQTIFKEDPKEKEQTEKPQKEKTEPPEETAKASKATVEPTQETDKPPKPKTDQAGVVLKPGARVARGPDWTWSNADGGQGRLGTVLDASRTYEWATVRWDVGGEGRYNFGNNGKYELELVLDEVPAITELRKLSVKELKALLTRCYVNLDGCIDKETLLERAKKLGPPNPKDAKEDVSTVSTVARVTGAEPKDKDDAAQKGPVMVNAGNGIMYTLPEAKTSPKETVKPVKPSKETVQPTKQTEKPAEDQAPLRIPAPKPTKPANAVPAMQFLQKLSAKELKHILTKANVSIEGCFDKEALLERASRSQAVEVIASAPVVPPDNSNGEASSSATSAPERRRQLFHDSPKKDVVVSKELFTIGDKVRAREADEKNWYYGTVTSTKPLEVQIDGFKTSLSFDIVEHARPQVPSMDELQKMSIKELKEVLTRARLNMAGCIDRETMLERAKQLLDEPEDKRRRV